MLAAVGCGVESEDGLDRHNVYGKVTLDGAPLTRGVISFEPDQGTSGGVPAGAAIIDGSYNIPQDQGPTPGRYRVSIQSAGEGGDGLDPNAPPGAPPKRKKGAKAPIPKKYNVESTLKAEVKSSGSTEANFDLESR